MCSKSLRSRDKSNFRANPGPGDSSWNDKSRHGPERRSSVSAAIFSSVGRLVAQFKRYSRGHKGPRWLIRHRGKPMVRGPAFCPAAADDRSAAIYAAPRPLFLPVTRPLATREC